MSLGPKDTHNKRFLGLHVTQEQYDWAHAYATRNSITISDLIRAMLVDAMEEDSDLQRGSAPGREGGGKAREADGTAAPRDHKDDHGHSAREAVGL